MELFKGVLLCFMKIIIASSSIRINKDFSNEPFDCNLLLSKFWERGGGHVFKKLNIQTKLACIS